MCRQGSRRQWSCRLGLPCWHHSSKDLQLGGCMHWAAGQAHGAGVPLHAFSCPHKAMELQVVGGEGVSGLGLSGHSVHWGMGQCTCWQHEAVQGCRQRLCNLL